MASQLRPLLNATKSPSLRNLVINYANQSSGGTDEGTLRLLASISERLWVRLNEFGTASEVGSEGKAGEAGLGGGQGGGAGEDGDEHR